MSDIIIKTDNHIFTYRVAGILVQNEKVLLQTTSTNTGFAFPGGHVEYGETGKDALLREFKEEMGVDIEVLNMEWVSEVFFPWQGKPCQQICFYYRIALKDNSGIPLNGKFSGKEYCAKRNENIVFHWVSLSELKDMVVYPTEAEKLLANLGKGMQHFICGKD